MAETASTAIRSPFYKAHAELGATFMEEGGWLWTESFGDLDAEYRGVREDLGVWDVSPLNKWSFRGRDALKAAARLHTNNVAAQQVGQVHYGAFCDSDGLMVDDGTVFKFSDDRAWVMTNGRELDDHFAEVTKGMAVDIEYIGLELPHLGLQGPRSREALSKVCSVDISNLHYFHFITEPVKVGGVPCWVSRTGFGGELGYELFCKPENAEDLWSVVIEQCGARPFGVEAIEVLRIESGLIVTDYDYHPHERTPFDFSFDKLVAFAGSDFNGEAALRNVAANPPRRFKTLVLETEELPEYGAAVTSDGEPAGTLTSPTKSPRFGQIGLAILESRFSGDGQMLEVALGDSTVAAKVDVLPIYDPQKRRPRS
ncbi:MAG TPA: aminomethyltransferase family protein [Candidatus Dormibacteraeota bacterium]|nr:aminomethyltransferase family protein [Candidatus Dormibacteraeota bacterium]